MVVAVVTVVGISLLMGSLAHASPLLLQEAKAPIADMESTQPAYSADGILQKSLELAEKTSNEAFKAAIRWKHAQELLGKKYHRSVVKSGEKMSDVDGLIHNWVQSGLKKPYKRYAKALSATIAEESTKYGMDPVFLLAVIENESSFDTTVVGSHGEIGLMQITPETAKWVSEKFGVPYKGKNSLKNPMVNVRLGACYLAYLREKFDNQGHLYLAAYNMGSRNVYRALAKQVTPKIYSDRVMNRYLKFYAKLKAELQRIASDLGRKSLSFNSDGSRSSPELGSVHEYNVSFSN